ncbi:CvpA family protein [Longitalea luteola]|uniref:CvpA family protein n=1 Tax=Longitalea luteola TaxID=2812563 RepID=UPI001A9604EF|nr:CvpA family protein [Longitalea luteola]
MNWIDILLLIIVAYGIWDGWQKGFILELLYLLGLIISIAATFLLYPYPTMFINKYFPSLGSWALPLAFIATYVVVRVLINLLTNKTLHTIPVEAHGRWDNKFLGILPGALNGIAHAVIVAALVLALPISNKITDKTRESRFVVMLSVPAEWIETKLSLVFTEVERTMNRLTVKPGSDETVILPFTVIAPPPRGDLETLMLSWVNGERIKRGLNILKADPELTAVARKHSVDMFQRGYFSHVAPDGKGPFDRMRNDGVRFTNAGENIALAPTLDIAHSGLMHSPGHRANILRPEFGRLGIGIVDGGKYGLMISQEFRN